MIKTSKIQLKAIIFEAKQNFKTSFKQSQQIIRH